MAFTRSLQRRSYAAALSLCLAVSGEAADPALTIYNQDFAVIRETVPLELHAGSNSVQFFGATARLEPDSVLLLDPTGTRPIHIVEQNYRADTISEAYLLSLFEGKTIEFVVGRNADGSPETVKGKVIRSGHVRGTQPVIEVNGGLQFFLPGQPLFPDLGNGTILKPALDWTIESKEAARFDAELSYVSTGMTWKADYNLVSPPSGDSLDLVGWVTLSNESGAGFEHARVKLMAGDVNKIAPQLFARTDGTHLGIGNTPLPEPRVTERAFDEYHLYTLPLPTTLRDRETKQVEFIRARRIASERLYVYDGQPIASPVQDAEPVRNTGNTHVWVMREFKNSEANHLGLPLPKGRLRFYRQDEDGQLEFIGENTIDHTPKEEVVRVYTGNAFDIAGERKQLGYHVDESKRTVDESFEIKLRNHKKEQATVHAVEHLNRWDNWKIAEESDAHRKLDARTIEYVTTLQPNEEKTLTYSVHYTW